MTIYIGAVRKPADWLTDCHPEVRARDQVRTEHINEWISDLLASGRTPGYASNLYRAVQQFVKWGLSEEDDPRPDDGRHPATGTTTGRGGNGAMTRSGIWQMLERSGAEAGLPEVAPHMLRHTWAHYARLEGRLHDDETCAWPAGGHARCWTATPRAPLTNAPATPAQPTRRPTLVSNPPLSLRQQQAAGSRVARADQCARWLAFQQAACPWQLVIATRELCRLFNVTGGIWPTMLCSSWGSVLRS